MLNIEETDKSVQEVVDAISNIIADYKFGILHIHNPKETLQSKGLDFNTECQILDVCSPRIAKIFLDEDMSLSSILPCKISVYDNKGKTTISMNSLVQAVDDINPDLIEIAQEAQDTLLEIISKVK